MKVATLNPFKIEKKEPSSKARAGVLSTPHGLIETPVFMPVGTQASVKTMDSSDLEGMGYPIILGNTYHLFLRPGLETLVKAGGLHQFMSWPNSILTDSGGYQVFSLATRCTMDEQGVEFSSHVDGSRRKLTPEITTQFQLDIGSDIAMCLDDCPPYPSLKKDTEESLERTLRWAQRCRVTYDNWLDSSSPNVSIGDPASLKTLIAPGDRLRGNDGGAPLLFGIVQGSTFSDLRKRSAEGTVEIGFPGYAIGGLGLGEPKENTWQMAEVCLASLPEDSPHYLMGFGQPEDMWEGVERGIDMFDCVLPTRNGRNGQGFTSEGRINVTNSIYREDFGPLDPACSCLTCQRHTRAYLCHLFRAGEHLAPRLVTLHNLSFMISLLRSIRKSIIDGNFQEAKRKFYLRFNNNERR